MPAQPPASPLSCWVVTADQVPGSGRFSAAEMDSARLQMLRDRVIIFATVTGILVIALTGISTWVGLRLNDGRLTRGEWTSISGGYIMGIMLMIMPRLRRGRLARESMNQIVRRMTIVLCAAVFTQVTSAEFMAQGLEQWLNRDGGSAQIGPALPAVVFFMILSTAASFVIPWRPIDAARVAALFGIISGIVMLFSGDPPLVKVMGVILALAAGAPGTIISFLRFSRIRDVIALQLLSGRYDEVERELSTARRIHDRLFPVPRDIGRLRFTYEYEPMRSIGGDYLDLIVSPGGAVTLILIDVTGHGIPAALAVNRLHGEIRRVLAASPDLSPGQLMEALNSYVQATLSDETVFATALAIRINPGDGSCVCCNAGHPPAFLARRDRSSVERIDSTSLVLGVVEPHSFAGEETTFHANPGDLIIVYTDGAIECRDVSGRHLQIEGLREVIERHKNGPQDVQRMVELLSKRVRSHRAGPAEDDTLIAGIEVLESPRSP